MQPHKKTLSELFDHQRLHVVPLFQRPYVWSREKQWEPLWDDIADRAIAVLEQKQTGDRRPIPPHFLGAIVTSQVRTYGREIDKREVIDGQQRLTTLQVLLAAFRDFVADKDTPLHDTLERLTQNAGVMANEEERHKVWPTNADRPTFSAVMAARSAESLAKQFPLLRRKWQRKPDPRPPLVEAYLCFHEAISEFCAVAGAEGVAQFSPERADALFEAIRRHIQLVHIDLDDDDDPQVIFETLNARGEPLLPSDLIRNFLFLRAARQDKDVAAIYEAHWRDYDERAAEDDGTTEKRFWKREERQGRLRRPRLDLFLFHYLQLTRSREVAIGHLYKEFREWWAEGPGGDRDVENELRELRRHSDVFVSLFAPSGNTAEATFARRLRVLDTSTVYPLALFLLTQPRESLPASELSGILTDIASYLVRRMITGATTKNYNRFFIALLAHVRGPAGLSHSVVRSYLSGATGDSAWPDDRTFERAWMETPSYEDLGWERTAMVLEAIERHMRTSKQEGLTLPVLTVEHVMPQDWSAHWPMPTDKPTAPQDGGDPRWRRERLLHTFGNLTLLTRELNSAVSNGPYARKRSEIAEQSELRLNTWFQTHAEWSESAILERGRHLLGVATQVWPRPA